jgi:VCBS repeat-containing protein
MAKPTTPPASKPEVQTVAQADTFGATEDVLIDLAVLSNDRGNNLVLYSLDQNTAVTTPAAATTAKTAMGATVTIMADGTVAYDSTTSASAQALAAGQQATDTFVYWVQQGGSYSKATVTVTVTGTNDAPVVSGAIVGTATEDGVVSSLSALAKASDVDAGTTLEVVVPAAADLPAGVSYDTATKSFKLDPTHTAYQSLGRGETTTVTVNYGVSDGTATTSASAIWTVTGTNDAPTIAAATTTASGSITEIADDAPGEGVTTHTVSGWIAFEDLDVTDTHSLSLFSSGPPIYNFSLGGIDHANKRISWSFEVNDSGLNSLAAGATVTQSYTVGILDGNGGSAQQVVNITITGANDAPVVLSAVTGTATEDGSISTVDALAKASDVDAGTTLQVVNVPAAGDLPPGVSYDAAAKTFTLDPTHTAYESLAAGRTATVTVNYGVSDGTATTPASVSWTVTGTNDTPVITGTSQGEVTEDSTLTASGRLIVSDPDAGESGLRPVAAGTSGSKGYGSFEVKGDGSWVYTLDNSNPTVQALNSGQSLTDSIIVYSSDDSAPQTLSVTIRGTNDEKIVMGTPENDQPLMGTDDGERIIGNGSEDFIYGLGGNDTIEMSDNGGGRAYGGLGDDAIYGGDSSLAGTFVANLMNGGEGNDGHIGGLALAPGSVVHNIAIEDQAGRDTYLGGDAMAGYVKNLFSDTVGGGHMRGGVAANSALVYNSLQGGMGSDYIVGGDGRSSASFDMSNPGQYAFGTFINTPTPVSVINIINAGGGIDQVVAGQGRAYNHITMGDLSAADHITGGGAYTALLAHSGLGAPRNDHLVVTTEWRLNGEVLRINGTINEFQFRTLSGNDTIDFSQSAFSFSNLVLNGGSNQDTLIGQTSGRTTFVLEEMGWGDSVTGLSLQDTLHILPLTPTSPTEIDLFADGDVLDISGGRAVGVESLRITVQQAGGTIRMHGNLSETGLQNLLIEASQATGAVNVDLRGVSGGSHQTAIRGGRGDDFFAGSRGNDFIDLLSGNDHIDLSAGGSDTIQFCRGSEHDIVVGFTAGSQEGLDIIDLRGQGVSDFEWLMQNAVSADGESIIIQLTSGDSITLLGVDMNQLTADNFIFG